MAKTLRQQKVINNLLADGGSLASAMVKAGYSKKTARSPKKFTESPNVKPDIENILSQLANERQAIILRLKETRSKAKYRDLMDGLDKVTKVHQLLSGGKTENVGIEGLGNDLKALIDSVKNADS